MDGPVSQANLSDLLVSLKQLIADEESEAADPVLRKKAERLFLDPSLRINAGGQEPAVESIVRPLSLKDKVAKLEGLIDLGAGAEPEVQKSILTDDGPEISTFSSAMPMHARDHRPRTPENSSGTQSPDSLLQMDNEDLELMISEIIRRELRGVLGEKITKNVRNLVQHEVRAALKASDG